MFDASAKYPYAIIDGLTRHLGSFDQCYRINVKLPADRDKIQDHIQGRYCLVDFKYQQMERKKDSKGYLDFNYDPNDSVWEAIKVCI